MQLLRQVVYYIINCPIILRISYYRAFSGEHDIFLSKMTNYLA